MKDNEALYSEVPKPPKGIGISRRLLFTIAGGLVLIVILFLYFLNHYAPHPIKKVSNENSQGSADSAISLIEKIQGQTHKPLLIGSKSEPPIKPKNIGDADGLVTETTQKSLSQNDFKEASNAAISVYHSNTQYIENHSSSILSYPNASGTLQNYNSDIVRSSDAYVQQNLQSEKIAFLKSNDSLKKIAFNLNYNSRYRHINLMPVRLFPLTS